MLHRALLLALAAFLQGSVHAEASKHDKLIGLPLEELIACAGIPQAQMTTGSVTFLQYGEFEQRGALLSLGGTLFLANKQRGCQATVAISGGNVIRVDYKSKGLISGPLACERLFSGCGD